MTPTVVVVGAATRDLVADDPRGWRMGGGVTYSALVTARLGLPTGALIGVDETASAAPELDLLRSAGVEVRTVPLEHGPVFENIERPEGRIQISGGRSDPIAPERLPDDWRRAPGWLLVPIAGELSDPWASVPASEARVALGWQGLLRELPPGEPVRPVAPRPTPLVRRADLLGISRDDVDPAISLAELAADLRPGATLVVTHGDRGGVALEASPEGPRRLRHYPAVRSRGIVDATGAGDVFLAALAAAWIEPRIVGGRLAAGFDLLIAAVAASLVLEGPGLLGVPDREAIRQRMGALLRERAGTGRGPSGPARGGADAP